MEREEAINVLLEIRSCIIDNAQENALDIAIDALSKPSLPSNLEEAVEEYAPDFSNDFASKAAVEAMREAFIAGAKWQKEQHKSVSGKYAKMDFESARNTFSEDVYNHNRKNKTPIDIVDLDDVFETGADWMEKQMLKEAVEGEIFDDYDKDTCEHHLTILSTVPSRYKDGDKVQVIILSKED